jgi:VanZ family protein
LAVVSVLYAFNVSLSHAIRVTLWLGTASLGYWGFVAGRRAGLVGWRMVAVVAAGLLIGAVILLIQVFLQPGKAFSGGVALG